jgi:tetratricopeptide (TPR) repeat protein
VRTHAPDAQVSWGNYATVLARRVDLTATPAEAEAARGAAIAACRRALQHAIGYPDAREMLVRLLDRETPLLSPRRAEGAEEAWRLALALQGERTGRDVHEHLDRPLPAVQTLAAYLATRPSLAGREDYVRPMLGFACVRVAEALGQDTANLAPALVWLDHASELDPNAPLVAFRRGLVLKRLGRPVEAEAAYLRARELGMDDAGLHNNLGNLQLAAGRVEEAVASFERALAVDPDNETIRDNLERARARR